MKEMMDRIIAAKEERRRQLAGLPFEEKIRIIVQLQKMIAPILQSRGIDARPWDIKVPEPPEKI